jgi:hypothetical protein
MIVALWGHGWRIDGGCRSDGGWAHEVYLSSNSSIQHLLDVSGLNLSYPSGLLVSKVMISSVPGASSSIRR